MGQDVHDITTSLQHEGFWPKVGIERQSYIYIYIYIWLHFIGWKNSTAVLGQGYTQHISV